MRTNQKKETELQSLRVHFAAESPYKNEFFLCAFKHGVKRTTNARSVYVLLHSLLRIFSTYVMNQSQGGKNRTTKIALNHAHTLIKNKLFKRH